MQNPIRNRISTLAVILLIGLGGLVQSQYCRTYCSSQFHRYFEGLGATEVQVNPVERFLFSVLLTRTKAEPQTAPAPQLSAKKL